LFDLESDGETSLTGNQSSEAGGKRISKTLMLGYFEINQGATH